MNQNLLRVNDEVRYDRSASSYSTSWTRGIVQKLKLNSVGKAGYGRPDHVLVRRLHEDGSEWNYPEGTNMAGTPVLDIIHARRVQMLWSDWTTHEAEIKVQQAWAEKRREQDALQEEWLSKAVEALNINLQYDGGRLKLVNVTHDEAPGVQGTLANNYNRYVTWVNLVELLGKKLKIKLPTVPEVIWEDHPNYNEETGDMNG